MSRVRSSIIETIKRVAKRRYSFIAVLAALGIFVHVLLRFGTNIDVAGAVMQEANDVAAVLNAPRMALPPGRLTDFWPSMNTIMAVL